jgi:hypothetical protein
MDTASVSVAAVVTVDAAAVDSSEAVDAADERVQCSGCVTRRCQCARKTKAVKLNTLPCARHKALKLAFRDPADKIVDNVVRVPERNMFPMIPRVKAHCVIDNTLDRCLQCLQNRLTDETVRSQRRKNTRNDIEARSSSSSSSL